ncbi:MAG: hypothetical protein CFE23_07525 [Flavobacterium sp. BFFFF1]|uniref:hypothetical protein n=1 Tax=Flavobacterium sp. BFFFF1 TaxID=2015557 RepID=UPI000BCE4BC9|nr:hypothetical protein [Flavobacterium sp. BFFFF1]OYU80808.1 MAG: hypothetical protein CFE23_07525 [Flavobacterium sp. BFFFF1]
MRGKTGLLAIGIIICGLAIKFYFIGAFNSQGAYEAKNAFLNNGDAGHYLQIAKHIGKFHEYSDLDKKGLSENATWRPPLWPFLLSPALLLTNNLLIVVILKTIFETALILFSLLFIKKRSGRSFKFVIPFLFLLLEPHYLKYSVTFLSESLTAVLILLLAVLFVYDDRSLRSGLRISVLAALIILCHPVAVFFIATLFSVHFFITARKNLRDAFLQALLFIGLVGSWGLRNELSFHKGWYLTASQGAVFSKGWNEQVVSDFTNTQGDNADESINLKFLTKESYASASGSVLDMGKFYRKGTIAYIEKIGFFERLKIIYVKLRSNFNPFPETPKEGWLEKSAIVLRGLWLLVFFQSILLVVKRVFYRKTVNSRVLIVVLSVLSGQLLMAILIYTGLRFNAIYGLCLLACFLFLNLDILTKIYKKTQCAFH